MSERSQRTDPEEAARRFIRDNLRLSALSVRPDIRLHTAHPGSGLRRILAGGTDGSSPPYWAYCWAGGLALACHLAERAETVADRRVLDLGSGGGVVAIAAALAGAASVTAAEIDPYALSALSLNAAENGVSLEFADGDILAAGPPAGVDLVLAGDMFYGPRVARRVTAFLDRCLAAGIDVLIGDPGRRDLPVSRLDPVADYAVPDFGDGAGNLTRSRVYRMRRA